MKGAHGVKEIEHNVAGILFFSKLEGWVEGKNMRGNRSVCLRGRDRWKKGGAHLSALNGGDDNWSEAARSCGPQQQLLVEADPPGHQGPTHNCNPTALKSQVWASSLLNYAESMMSDISGPKPNYLDAYCKVDQMGKVKLSRSIVYFIMDTGNAVCLAISSEVAIVSVQTDLSLPP